MQTNLESAVKNVYHLFVNTRPFQLTQSYTERNEAGEPVGETNTWDEEVLRGVWMSNIVNPSERTELEIKIRPQQLRKMNLSSPMFDDVMEMFFENKKDLQSGKKYMIVETLSLPKARRNGDKEGVSDLLTPVLSGLKIAESNQQDLDFIERVLASNATPEGVDTENAAV